MNEKFCFGTVDFHAHPVDEAFRNQMDFLGIDPMEEDGFPLPEWDAEKQLAFMEAAGIDSAVLSVPTPHIHNGNDEKACAAARAINESVAGLCATYPEKFAFAAVLPLPCVEGAITGSRLCHGALGRCRGKAGDKQRRRVLRRSVL